MRASNRRYMNRIFPRPTWTFCHYCEDIIVGREITRDHLEAKVKDGSMGRDNLVLSCFLCNFLKGKMEYFEFKRFFKIFSRKNEIPILKVKMETFQPPCKITENIKKLRSEFIRFVGKEKSRLAAADLPTSSPSPF